MQSDSAQHGALRAAEAQQSAHSGIARVGTRRRSIVLALWQNENGVIAVLMALSLTVLIGIVVSRLDVAMWYRNNAPCKTRRIPQ